MYSLLLQTIQASVFRTLLDAMKDIITETNIFFDETGMKIKTVDASHTVLVHMKLEAEQFDKYICKKPIVIGVNILHFYKLTKSISPNDVLTLMIEEGAYDKLCIQVVNSKKKMIRNTRMNLLDLNQKTFKITPKEFDFVINMSSVEFQRICRDMNMITDILDLKAINECLYFKGQGDFADQEFTMKEHEGGLTFVKGTDSNEIVQGLFLLKHLITFTRCTNLSDTIDIYLTNDYPLIIAYKVGSLGMIKLCLSPKLMIKE